MSAAGDCGSGVGIWGRRRGSFAKESFESLDSSQLSRFEALLDCADPDLFDWIFGVSAPAAGT
jgi:succinate dehydrogenase flavin-adding protein (antitoxin of CptAB toxin-antitoxin module)